MLILTRQFAFQGSELGTVIEHLADQTPLGFNGLTLLEDERGQQAIREDKQHDQDRKHGGRPGCLLGRFALSAIDDCQNVPPNSPRNVQDSLLCNAPGNPYE